MNNFSRISGGSRETVEARAGDHGRLAWLLDSSIPLPGGFRIGIDGLIGLIPGIGDAIGGGLSTWIFYQAWREGVPKMVLARMFINILIDAVIGAIPILGDLFDFVWKANLRNVTLIEKYKRMPRETQNQSTVITLVFFIGLFVVAFGLIYGAIAIAAWLWQTLTQGGAAGV